MDCEECARLERIRYDCILRYAELAQARTRIQAENQISTPALDEAIPQAEARLNTAWKALDDHRKTHQQAQGARA